MGVIMQAFYWDCPKLENREFQWWKHIEDVVPSLKAAGFTAFWLPPASKAANIGGQSMGYDPYDYYDRGDAWNGAWVRTGWSNTKFVPTAWRGGNDAGIPQDKWSQGDSWCDFWAPPRGYAVYIPQI